MSDDEASVGSDDEANLTITAEDEENIRRLEGENQEGRMDAIIKSLHLLVLNLSPKKGRGVPQDENTKRNTELLDISNKFYNMLRNGKKMQKMLDVNTIFTGPQTLQLKRKL
jgi:hypothetical protein